MRFVGLDQRQPGRRHAGLEKPVAVMGEIGEFFQWKFRRCFSTVKRRIIAEQRLGCLGRLVAAAELAERRGPHREHLKMVGVEIEPLARPGQRCVVLSQQIMAEGEQGRPLIAGVGVAALHGHREQLDRFAMLADDEMAHAEDATRTHVIGVELDGPCRSFPGRVVVPLMPCM